jgi:hypothetical protein
LPYGNRTLARLRFYYACCRARRGLEGRIRKAGGSEFARNRVRWEGQRLSERERERESVRAREGEEVIIR